VTDLYQRQQSGIAGVTKKLNERDLQAVLRFLRAANESTHDD
jgi:hypothetical protein